MSSYKYYACYQVLFKNFYESQKWKSLRGVVYSIYKKRCMKCSVKEGQFHIDHIKPKSKYPEMALDIYNLQILCKACNIEKSNKEQTDYRKPEDRRSLNKTIKTRSYKWVLEVDYYHRKRVKKLLSTKNPASKKKVYKKKKKKVIYTKNGKRYRYESLGHNGILSNSNPSKPKTILRKKVIAE